MFYVTKDSAMTQIVHSPDKEGFAVFSGQHNVPNDSDSRCRELCLNIQSISAIDSNIRILLHVTHKNGNQLAFNLFYAIHLVADLDFIASYRWIENVARNSLAVMLCVRVRTHLWCKCTNKCVSWYVFPSTENVLQHLSCVRWCVWCCFMHAEKP